MIKGENADYSRAHFWVIQDGIYPIIPPYYRVDTIRCSDSGKANLLDTIAIKIKTKHIDEVMPIIPKELRDYAFKVWIASVKFKSRGYKSYWRHNRNGKRYALIRELTLKDTDEASVLYEDIITREQFVRTKKNFYKSFTEVK